MKTAIVYPVAGLSSRFGSIKQFVKVAENETLIEHSLKQSFRAGFNKIIFIVGNKTKKPFKEKFGNSYNSIPIVYLLQNYDEKIRDKPWGTVDALCTIKSIIQEPFVFCNSDDIYGEKTFKLLHEHLQNHKEEAAIGYNLIDAIPKKGKTNRAMFKEKDGFVTELQEIFGIEKDKLEIQNLKEEDLCSMNIFAFHQSTVFLLHEKLETFKKAHANDRKAECLLPDELGSLIKEKKIQMRLYKAEEKWFGVTNPGDEKIIQEYIKSKLKANI